MLAIAAVLVILWVLVPVGLGILVGTLLAFTVYHSYRSLVRRTRRPALVAAGMTALATVVVGGILAALSYALVRQGIELGARLPQAFAPGSRANVFLDEIAAPLAILGVSPQDIAGRLRGAIGDIATALAGLAAQTVGLLLDGLLALFFTAITMFFVLTRWKDLARRAEYMMPINPHHTRRLLRELRRIGRTAVVGNLGTAVIQGAIAGVGYAVARVPGAAFFGALTAIASLVPVVGTTLLWLPAALFLFGEGRVVSGVFLLVWGSLAVVGFCDYFVRPRLVGGGETMPTWMTLVALFGGIKLFGFIGFLLGPLLVGFALATLRLYGRTRRFRLGLR
jgi:predicted PurR-regulated permease PerM